MPLALILRHYTVTSYHLVHVVKEHAQVSLGNVFSKNHWIYYRYFRRHYYMVFGAQM